MKKKEEKMGREGRGRHEENFSLIRGINYLPAPMHPAVNTSQLSLGLSQTIFVKASRTVVSKNRSVRTNSRKIREI